MKIERQSDGTTAFEDQAGRPWLLPALVWLSVAVGGGLILTILSQTLIDDWARGSSGAYVVVVLFIFALAAMVALALWPLFANNTTLIIDPAQDRLLLEKRRVHTTKVCQVRLSDIVLVELEDHADENYQAWRSVLVLKSGERINLYFHGVKPEGADDPVAAIQAAIDFAAKP